jgi:hypothetical protein
VRALVILTAEGPRLLKAAWKLPSEHNIADNYWRPGNMMASIDPDTGRALRLVSGFGTRLQEFDREPATSRRVTEMIVPDWAQLRNLSLAATGALGHLRLVGWDIGITKTGPVIVEANATPDFGLHQIAEGQGMLSDEFTAFVRFCKSEARRLSAEKRRRSRTMVAGEIAQLRAHSQLNKPQSR